MMEFIKQTEFDFDIDEPLNMDFLGNDTYTILPYQNDDSKTLPVDYEQQVANKPSINGVILIGDKTSKDIKVQDIMDAATIAEIEKILYLDL